MLHMPFATSTSLLADRLEVRPLLSWASRLAADTVALSGENSAMAAVFQGIVLVLHTCVHMRTCSSRPLSESSLKPSETSSASLLYNYSHPSFKTSPLNVRAQLFASSSATMSDMSYRGPRPAASELCAD